MLHMVPRMCMRHLVRTLPYVSRYKQHNSYSDVRGLEP